MRVGDLVEVDEVDEVGDTIPVLNVSLSLGIVIVMLFLRLFLILLLFLSSLLGICLLPSVGSLSAACAMKLFVSYENAEGLKPSFSTMLCLLLFSCMGARGRGVVSDMTS